MDERAAEDRSNDASELSPLEACMQMSLLGSTYLRLAGDGEPAPLEDDRFRAMVRSVKMDLSSSPTALFHGGVHFQSARAAGLARVQQTLAPCVVILASAMASEAADPGR